MRPHENAVGKCPQNTGDPIAEGTKTKDDVFMLNDVVDTHAHVEETWDNVQLAFQESIISTVVAIAEVGTKERDEEEPETRPISIGGGIEMPPFRIRYVCRNH